ncbi:hypothetical protein PSYPI_39679 [Pseudomonas syringae pv. pisi str. 1704B]|uniref:Uncharacterized protein n=1 Tax=Pseudomonas syringae pv. pisi str. 1704B TaxID=629263 RepID=F3GLX7_PSESJ|nr:hypothetical protein PSYPI_39679 [Pseudomonas syringae pv. pisi str. 1704B]
MTRTKLLFESGIVALSQQATVLIQRHICHLLGYFFPGMGSK